jgi:hypothetical protein
LKFENNRRPAETSSVVLLDLMTITGERIDVAERVESGNAMDYKMPTNGMRRGISMLYFILELVLACELGN